MQQKEQEQKQNENQLQEAESQRPQRTSFGVVVRALNPATLVGAFLGAALAVLRLPLLPVGLIVGALMCLRDVATAEEHAEHAEHATAGPAAKPPPCHRGRLSAWLHESLGAVVRDRGRDAVHAVWLDGGLMCLLVQRSTSARCPHSRHPNGHVAALKHGFRMVKTHLGIPSGFSDEELDAVTLTTFMEKRLVRYLCAVRRAVQRRQRRRESSPSSESSGSGSGPGSVSGSGSGSGSRDELGSGGRATRCVPRCVPRGVGLFMATRNQVAVFNVYVRTAAVADLRVEVFGPCDTFGASGPAPIGEGTEDAAIPVAFLVSVNKVEVRYTPRRAGPHHVHVKLAGSPVIGSPFHVQVAEQDTPPPAPDEEAVEESSTGVVVPSPRKYQRSPRRRRIKVVYRIVDFVTEKMLLTEDGRLERLPDAIVSHNTTPPRVFVRYPRHGAASGGTTPKKRKKPRSLRMRVKPRPPDSDSDASPPPSPPPAPPMAAESRCLRILRTCALILQHFPKARSLHIMRAAESIASTGSYLCRATSLRIVHPEDDDDLEGLTEAADLPRSLVGIESDVSAEEDHTHVELLSAAPSRAGSSLSVEGLIVAATKTLVIGVLPELTELLDVAGHEEGRKAPGEELDVSPSHPQEAATVPSLGTPEDKEVVSTVPAPDVDTHNDEPVQLVDLRDGVGESESKDDTNVVVSAPDEDAVDEVKELVVTTPSVDVTVEVHPIPEFEQTTTNLLLPEVKSQSTAEFLSDHSVTTVASDTTHDGELGEFKSWTSSTAFGDPEQDSAVEVSLESVISAPSLDEALRQLDASIQRAMVREEDPDSQRDVLCELDGMKFTLEGSGQIWAEGEPSAIDDLLGLVSPPPRPESPRPPLCSWMSVIKEEGEEEVVPARIPQEEAGPVRVPQEEATPARMPQDDVIGQHSPAEDCIVTAVPAVTTLEETNLDEPSSLEPVANRPAAALSPPANLGTCEQTDEICESATFAPEEHDVTESPVTDCGSEPRQQENTINESSTAFSESPVCRVSHTLPVEAPTASKVDPVQSIEERKVEDKSKCPIVKPRRRSKVRDMIAAIEGGPQPQPLTEEKDDSPLPLPRSTALVMNIEKQRAKTSGSDGKSLPERLEIASDSNDNVLPGEAAVVEPARGLTSIKATRFFKYLEESMDEHDPVSSSTIETVAISATSEDAKQTSTGKEKVVSIPEETVNTDKKVPATHFFQYLEGSVDIYEPAVGLCSTTKSWEDKIEEPRVLVDDGKTEDILSQERVSVKNLSATRFFSYLEGSLDINEPACNQSLTCEPAKNNFIEEDQAEKIAGNDIEIQQDITEVQVEKAVEDEPQEEKFKIRQESTELQVEKAEMDETQKEKIEINETQDENDETDDIFEETTRLINKISATNFFKYLESSVDECDPVSSIITNIVAEGPSSDTDEGTINYAAKPSAGEGKKDPATRFFKYLEESIDIHESASIEEDTMQPSSREAEALVAADLFLNSLPLLSPDTEKDIERQFQSLASDTEPTKAEVEFNTLVREPVSDALDTTDVPSRHELLMPRNYPPATRFFGYLEESMDVDDHAAILTQEMDASPSPQPESEATPPSEDAAAAIDAPDVETCIPEYGELGALQTRLGEGVSDDEVGHLADIADALESTIDGIEVAEMTTKTQREEEEIMLTLCDKLLLIAVQNTKPPSPRHLLPTLEPDDDILIVTQTGNEMTIRMVPSPPPSPRPVPLFAPENADPNVLPVPSPRRKHRSISPTLDPILQVHEDLQPQSEPGSHEEPQTHNDKQHVIQPISDEQHLTHDENSSQVESQTAAGLQTDNLQARDDVRFPKEFQTDGRQQPEIELQTPDDSCFRQNAQTDGGHQPDRELQAHDDICSPQKSLTDVGQQPEAHLETPDDSCSQQESQAVGGHQPLQAHDGDQEIRTPPCSKDHPEKRSPSESDGPRLTVYRSLEDISECPNTLSLAAPVQDEDLDSLISEAGFPLSMRVTHRKLFWDKQVERQSEDETATTGRRPQPTDRPVTPSRTTSSVKADGSRQQVLRDARTRTGAVAEATRRLGLDSEAVPSAGIVKSSRRFFESTALTISSSSESVDPVTRIRKEIEALERRTQVVQPQQHGKRRAPAPPVASTLTAAPTPALTTVPTVTLTTASELTPTTSPDAAVPTVVVPRSALKPTQREAPQRNTVKGAEIVLVEARYPHGSSDEGLGSALQERKERFERAKSFFKHLQDPCAPDVTPTRSRLPRPFGALPLEVHSDTDANTAGTAGQRSSERVAKVADRFHVKDVFQDVLGEGRPTGSLRGLRGTPHRKAVLASLSSMEALSPGEAASPYDSVAAEGDSDGGLLRKSFEDLDADTGPPSYSPPPVPGHGRVLPQDYQREFPYLSTTPITSYRHRSADSGRLHLIPHRDLLDMDI